MGPAEDTGTGFLGSIERMLGTNIELKERAVNHWGYLYRQSVIEDIRAVLRGTPSKQVQNRVMKGETGKLFTIG